MYVSERDFVITAYAQMQVLQSIWDVECETVVAPPQLKQTGQALDTVKRSASGVMARGVYRSALLCEDILARTGDDKAALQMGLASLAGLIGSYSDGLIEIDPEFKVLLAGEARDESPDIANPVSARISNDANLRTAQQAHQSARENLSPLLSLVKNKGRKQALKTLMQPIKPARTARTSEAGGERRTVKFDTLMRPVTNLTLSEARHSGKKVMLSYAADFDTLEMSLAKHVQEFLEILCLNIVAQGISASRPSASQISVTGQALQNMIKVSVNWSGRALERDEANHKHFFTAISSLHAAGGDILFHESALGQTDHGVQNIVLSIPLNQDANYRGQDEAALVYAKGG